MTALWDSAVQDVVFGQAERLEPDALMGHVM